MTGTPPSAPNEPLGDRPAEEGGPQHTDRPAHPRNPAPAAQIDTPAPVAEAGAHGPESAARPRYEGHDPAHYGNGPATPGAPQGAPGPHSGYPGAATRPLPPQQGGFPQGNPPAQGGFPAGGMPPGAGAPGPAQQAKATFDQPRERLDVGYALTYGWDRFRRNPIPWLCLGMIGVIAWLVVTLLVNIVDVRSLSAVLLLFGVAALVVWLLQAAMIRGALYETDGTPPDFPAFFGFVNAGNVLITALIVFAAALLASVLCLFPAVIVGVLGMFALHFVIDQDLDPLAAITASVRLVVTNALQVTLLALAVLVMTVIGTLLCGVGLLVAGPVSAIAITCAYRMLTGRLVVTV